jgi:hypothetical protein
VLAIIENPNMSYAKIKGYEYHIDIPNLRTVALTDPMKAIITNLDDGKSSAFVIWGGYTL